MQVTATAPPPAPAPPQAAVAGSPTITITGPDGVTQNISIPQSRSEVRAIERARTQLSNQIESAMGRRNDVAGELRKATDAVDRTGLQQRLTVLDRRIAQLETDLAVTGRQLTAAPATLVGQTETPPVNDIPENVVAIVSVFTVFVLFPMAFALARNIWKRGSTFGKAAPAQLPAETAQRLERLEQGVEAIAIEIERVSEGQRFVTKLLSEAAPMAVKLPEKSAEATRI